MRVKMKKKEKKKERKKLYIYIYMSNVNLTWQLQYFSSKNEFNKTWFFVLM